MIYTPSSLAAIVQLTHYIPHIIKGYRSANTLHFAHNQGPKEAISEEEQGIHPLE